jgi:xanthine dehydrogenase YagS FAD-binding subunit
MNRFEHVDAVSIEDAISWLDEGWDARIIGGGTDLLGEMKGGIIAPARLVNIKTISELRGIDDRGSDGIRIGALTTLTAVESDPSIAASLSILGQAAGSAASPQLRNMGTIAGNLCQRPRCWYYREKDVPCLRKGGKRCFAVRGDNRYHCILGGGPCFIVHPSDTAPALIALDARLTIAGPAGERTLPVEEFFVLPGTDPHRENVLQANELITRIDISAPDEGSAGVYIKFRERQSWDFAVVSVAAQLTLDGAKCTGARIVMGGVAPAPWRSREAESELEGRTLDAESIEKAADAAVAEAKPMSGNGYKVTIARNLVRQALGDLAGS